MLNPIIKWPGGKSRELKRIRSLIPPSKRWVEPFVGGGAFFFRLEPPAAQLNDAEEDLVGFYRAVRGRNAGFLKTLRRMAKDRVSLGELARERAARFAELVATARAEDRRVSPAEADALAGVDPLLLPLDFARLTIARSVANKVLRLISLEKKHGNVFDATELAPHYETALQAGYYTWVRDVWDPPARSSQLARFYFVRTLCYGSMFRYSKDGKFNIPYGGISYNRSRLAEKVARLSSAPVRELLRRAEFACEDFEPFLEKAELDADSFVFLDPPYDTEFSAYANRAFTAADHERLARVFADLPCPALLVIQRTPLIESLYDAERFTIVTYDKTYGYNVRGRNERKAKHMLILNYPAP